ncbi:MAG: retropepsin-like aspartic protease [Motiliproteus sp.]
MGDNLPTPGKRIGQGMWILFWCLLLAGLALYFSDREEQLYFPNETLRSTETDQGRQIFLSANRFGHYTLPGKINNQNVRFLIDTGATEVVIPQQVAESLGLKQGRKHWVRTANGDIEVYRTQIQTLNLGPIRLSNMAATINPHMEGEVLLGMSALRSLELNQKNGQLVLTQKTN